MFALKGRKVFYQTPQSDKQKSISVMELDYIKHEDGSIYNVSQQNSGTQTVMKETIWNTLSKDTFVPSMGHQGQLTINIGVGYSPGFDGEVAFVTPVFPVRQNPEYFTCSSITPSLGGTIDYGIGKKFSIGLAASYQSEMISHEETPYNDEISRTNAAIRFLYHLNRKSTRFDNYIGLRLGCSYWQDRPSLTSFYQTVPYPIPIFYFIGASHLLVPSFQFLYGICLYISDTFGFHLEAGIGSPYLIEGGITFRFNTQKNKAG